MPAVVVGPQSAADQDRLADLLGPDLFAPFLLLLQTPLLEDGEIRPRLATPSPRARLVVAGRSGAAVLLGRLGETIVRKAHVLLRRERHGPLAMLGSGVSRSLRRRAPNVPIAVGPDFVDIDQRVAASGQDLGPLLRGVQEVEVLGDHDILVGHVGAGQRAGRHRRRIVDIVVAQESRPWALFGSRTPPPPTRDGRVAGPTPSAARVLHATVSSVRRRMKVVRRLRSRRLRAREQRRSVVGRVVVLIRPRVS